MPAQEGQSTKLLIAIDGTGPESDSTYDGQYNQSFVRQIFEKSFGQTVVEPKSGQKFYTNGFKYYRRGPSLMGSEDPDIETEVVEWVKATLGKFRSGDNIEIYMTGWSRGAMLCVVVANKIQDFVTSSPCNVTIPKMLLFDPVCMDFTYTAPSYAMPFGDDDIYGVSYLAFAPAAAGTEIPTDTNMASPDTRMVPNIVQSVINLTTKQSLTRPMFVRDTLNIPRAGKADRPPKSFDCSHSAIGGLPGEAEFDYASVTTVVPEVSISVHPNPLGGISVGIASHLAVTTHSWGISPEQDRIEYEKVLEEVNADLDGFGIPGQQLKKFDPTRYLKS